MTKRSGKKIVGNIIKWILAVFMFTACLVYGFSFASVIFALLGVYFLPIAPVQNVFNKFMPKKKVLRGIIAFVIFVIGCCVAPQVETTTPEITPPSDITISSEVTTEPTEDVTAEVTTKPSKDATTDSTIESTTAPATEPTTESTAEPTTAPTVAPENSTFEIHFIDVGQADAALVECDGHYMLVDGGNKADSNVIYSVLKQAAVPKLDIVVGTHAHEDHIGGLPGAYNFTSADLTLCPVTGYDSEAFEDFAKYANQKGGGITVPEVGDTYSLGRATITILGVNGGSDTNDTSIIFRIVYGQTAFLFTGDAERDAEQSVLYSGADLSATVLKIGHHGSDTSTTYPFLREIMPQYAVISVGEGNSYGHPTEDTLSRLRDAEVQVFRTDMQGDIFCISDGTSVVFSVEKNADADVFDGLTDSTVETELEETSPPETEPVAAEGNDYVGNKSSRKFHYDWCSSVDQMKESNKYYYTGTREEMIKKGYEPCKRCDP